MAAWSEFNLEESEWRIPASRTKTGVEHRVPLSPQAVEALRRVEALRDSSDLVFPSPTKAGRPVSDMTMSKTLRACNIDEVCHGFRSSFRSWCQEQTDAPHAVAEMALGHAVGNSVERSYARSDLFQKRRTLMEAWGAYCVEEGDR